jgi:hypothetical protein
MNTQNKSNKQSLREEFSQWFHSAPRVWLIIGAVIVAFMVLRSPLGSLASTALFLALVFGLLYKRVA